MSELVAGVDEVGRGPLAGPVLAAAVILRPESTTIFRDSKKVSARQRARLATAVRAEALAFSLGMASADEIDALNILQATMLAMQRAVAGLHYTPARVLVDGNRVPDMAMPCEAIVGGDDVHPAIAAASILAKVTRDDWMTGLARRYPEYGFDGHKGYPTKVHLEALSAHGVTPQHRRTFGPVARILGSGGSRGAA